MRVISGRARGTKLVTIEGMDTRPTTDRVKEAIFSMLHSDVYESRAIDLFAGSGALGIECISRGGANVIFVEQARQAVSCIKENLKKTHFEDQGTVLQRDVLSALSTLQGETVDIIFMDPPYHKGFIKNVMSDIIRYEVLKINGIIVLEHHMKDNEVKDIPDAYECIKTKKYGITGVSVYRRIK